MKVQPHIITALAGKPAVYFNDLITDKSVLEYQDIFFHEKESTFPSAHDDRGVHSILIQFSNQVNISKSHCAYFNRVNTPNLNSDRKPVIMRDIMHNIAPIRQAA